MKTISRISVFAVSLLFGLGIFATASAATPILSVSQPVNGVVSLSISNADPNSPVTVTEKQSNAPTVFFSNFGYTNSQGNFNQSASLGADGSSNPVEIFVTVNGNRSSSVFIYPNGINNNGLISLSPSTLNLSAGQNASVTINSNYSYPLSGTYFISNNTNSNIASASISGNIVNVFALNSGSSVITICANNSSQCGTLFVSVSGSTGSNFTLSQNSITVTPGQSATVTINGNNFNNYVVSTNTTPSIANVTISGNTVYVYGLSAGLTNVTICQSNGTFCNNLLVTVNGTTGNNNITFSNSNPILNVGQNTTVTVSSFNSFNNSFFISNNSNSNVASANLSGNILNLYGISNGTTTITVCQSGNSSVCQALNVTVGYSTAGNIQFNPANPTLNVGQNLAVNLNGNNYIYNSAYYISNNSNPGIVSATITGNYLYLYGNAAGSANITVCPVSNQSQCGTVPVLVGGTVLGASQYNNGTLIQQNGTIYLIYKNTKVGFSSFDAFIGLGYKMSNVITADVSGLAQSSYIINSRNAPHPWGSWIQSGSTIYFADQFGLIPIADFSVFTNNGGATMNVVPANSYDMQRQILPIMQPNDPRLR